MSKTLMLSSLIAGIMTLGMASYKTAGIVQESRCKSFPERCGVIESAAEATSDAAAGAIAKEEITKEEITKEQIAKE